MNKCKSIWEERRDQMIDDLLEQGYVFQEIRNHDYSDLKQELFNAKH